MRYWTQPVEAEPHGTYWSVAIEPRGYQAQSAEYSAGQLSEKLKEQRY